MSANQRAILVKKKLPTSRVGGGGKVPQLLEVQKPDSRRVSKREMLVFKSLQKSLEESEAERKKQRAEKYKTRKEKIGTCECKKQGDILLVTSYTSEYNPRSGPFLYGRGSREQFRMVQRQECYCDACGAIYKAEVVKKAHR